MEDILNESFETPKRNAIFSKLAFAFSISGLVSFIMLVVNTFLILQARGSNTLVEGILAAILLLSTTLGISFTVTALVKKEKLKYFKAIGTILNIFLFIVVAGLMIYSLMET